MYVILAANVAVVVHAAVLAISGFTAAPATFYYDDVTFHSIGMVWDIDPDDDDHDATVSVQYRQKGSGTWKDALDLIRTDYQWYDASNHPPTQDKTDNFAGSIMFLTPCTNYEIKAQYDDPDNTDSNDGREFIVEQTTRCIPTKPTGGTTYYAVAGSGSGNAGTSGDPFEGLDEADSNVSPGDIVRLRDTNGAFASATLDSCGTEGNYIVYEPDTGHSPQLDQIKLGLNCSHMWFGPNLSFVWNDQASEKDTFVDGDVNTTTDRITLTGHSFVNGDEVYLTSTGTLPAPLLDRSYAVVERVDANTIELYEDTARTTIYDITSAAGGGTHTIGIHQSAQSNDDVSGIQIDQTATFDAIVSEDIIIEGNSFDNYFTSVRANRPVARWVVIDNDITGFKIDDLGTYPDDPGVPGQSGSSGKGVWVGGESSWQRNNDVDRPAYGNVLNNIVAFNNIQRHSDAAGYYETTDAYSNRVWDNSGNAQPDNSYENVRVWGNIFQRNWNGAMSLQPQRAGPHYYLYNQFANTGTSPQGTPSTELKTGARNIKFAHSDRAVMINNTHLGPVGAGQSLMMFYLRNNLWVRGPEDPAGGTNWKGETATAPDSTPGIQFDSWQADADYEGFITGSNGVFIRWYGTNYSSISSWATAFGGSHMANAVELDNTIWSGGWDLDPFNSMELAAGTNAAVDAGVSVPNLADWHASTPDLGAHQRDATALHYGPRNTSVDLDARTLYWDKH